MQRRELIKGVGAAAGGATLVGGGSFAMSQIGSGEGDSQEEGEEQKTEIQTVTDAPEEVLAAKPLGEAFLSHIRTYYESARVYPLKNGQLAMKYQSDAESGEELNKEFSRIAVEYIKVIKKGDFTPRTINIVYSEVQAVVTKASIKAHVSGEINQEAFLETIEVMSVERRTESE